MNCSGLPPEKLSPEDLVAWLDGECDAAEAARVEAHVAACSSCRREAELLRGSGALLARLPGMTAPAGFDARVVAASRAAPAGRVFRLRPRVAAAAAALVAVSAGVWWLAGSRDAAQPGVLTARDEEALADDLAVISSLDILEAADAPELAQIVDDLDVIDGLGPDGEGG
jgi:anti-sigma factor RsiW